MMNSNACFREYRTARTEDNYHRCSRILELYIVIAVFFLIRNIYYFDNEISFFPSYTSVYMLSLSISLVFRILMPVFYRRRVYRTLDYSILAVMSLLFFLLVNLCLLDSFFIRDVDFSAYIFGAFMLGFLYRTDWWVSVFIFTVALIYFVAGYYILKPDLFSLTAVLPLVPVSLCAYCFSRTRENMHLRLYKTRFELTESNRILTERSIRDTLTGLHNRRFMTEFLEHQIAQYNRHGTTLSLIFADIDFFKRINDELGHVVGDIVLKNFARILKGSCRDTDISIRYGGEEFLLILPDTDELEALNIAERVRQTMESFRFPSVPRSVTASFGIVEIQEGDDQDDLIQRADERLYMAKREGRNRCVTNLSCDVVGK